MNSRRVEACWTADSLNALTPAPSRQLRWAFFTWLCAGSFVGAVVCLLSSGTVKNHVCVHAVLCWCLEYFSVLNWVLLRCKRCNKRGEYNREKESWCPSYRRRNWTFTKQCKQLEECYQQPRSVKVYKRPCSVFESRGRCICRGTDV